MGTPHIKSMQILANQIHLFCRSSSYKTFIQIKKKYLTHPPIQTESMQRVTSVINLRSQAKIYKICMMYLP